MKLKYFMRGFGIGVVFTTLIVAISLTASSRKSLSDEEIIQKAEKLGMIMETTESYLASFNKKNQTETTNEQPTKQDSSDNEINDNIDSNEDNTSNSEVTTEPTINPTTEPTSSKTESTTDTANTTTVTTTQVTTASTTQTTTKTNSETTTSTVTNSQSELITIEIKKGTWSNHLASILKEKGLVDNAKDFDDYLIRNNYQNKIRVGVYKIEKGSTYEQIAKIVTN